MTSEQLFQFRLEILASLERVNEMNVIARRGLLEASLAQPGFHVDGADHARDEGELTTQIELNTRNLKLRNQLHSALQRLSNGTFGQCVKCEEEIDLRRLQVRPTALLCFQCQETQEREIATKLHPSLSLRSPEVMSQSLLTA